MYVPSCLLLLHIVILNMKWNDNKQFLDTSPIFLVYTICGKSVPFLRFRYIIFLFFDDLLYLYVLLHYKRKWLKMERYEVHLQKNIPWNLFSSQQLLIPIFDTFLSNIYYYNFIGCLSICIDWFAKQFVYHNFFLLQNYDYKSCNIKDEERKYIIYIMTRQLIFILWIKYIHWKWWKC